MIDPALSGHETQHGLLASSIQHHAVANADLSTPFRPERDILQDHDLAIQRAQTWTGLTRFGFNALLASSEYKNKLRLKPSKRDRIIYFLTHPTAASQAKDRADAQAKHQSQQWLYQSGILYRKESRLQQPRRHLAAEEVFDVLTAEHLVAGHAGRDKMLKVLEGKYIGYTKEEVMWVLEHCLVCCGKQIRGAAARRRERKEGLVDEGGVMT